MSVINDNLRITTLPFTITASGTLGATAVATVDQCSAFNVTCATAGLTMTLANPTIAPAGLRASVTNLPTSTQAFTMYGNQISINETAEFVWTGTVWSPVGDARQGATVTLATVPAGLSVVTHNFNLPTGGFSNVIFDAVDSVGSPVDVRRNVAGDTAIAMGVSSPLAIANITFRISRII